MRNPWGSGEPKVIGPRFNARIERVDGLCKTSLCKISLCKISLCEVSRRQPLPG